MTDEELRRLAMKELLAYVKGEASAMCPASKDYWKEHIEETLNGIAELESIITNHEFYQNGYKVAEKDCRVKFGKELYEKDNAIEIRDFRIKELEKEKCELLGIIQGKDKAIADLKMGLKWYADNRDELLKENAGMKARLNAINLLTPELEKASKEERQQLAKAKELLIGFVSKMKNSVYTPYEKDLIERSEQFLSEVKDD